MITNEQTIKKHQSAAAIIVLDYNHNMWAEMKRQLGMKRICSTFFQVSLKLATWNLNKMLVALFFRSVGGDCQKKCQAQVPQYITTGTMATYWPVRNERCSHGSSFLARWSASSLMILWLLWVLLWLPWPAPAEQVGGDGKSSSSSSSLSSSASSAPLSPASSSLFNRRQSGQQLDWLLSEKGPFHRCPEYTEFRERFQQGFSTRYKIYR